MLDVTHLRYHVFGTPLLKGVSFSLARGERVALLGPSGVGKTTLLRLLAGLLTPQEGTLRVESPPLLLQQQPALLPWRSVLANLQLFPTCQGESVTKHHAEKALQRVGLAGKEELYPHQLSQGMKQRVALARFLLSNSPLLLLDEPFSSIDLVTKEALLELLQNLHQQKHFTALLVTHDYYEALSFADRIFFLDQGELQKEWVVAEGVSVEEIKAFFNSSSSDVS